jgi:hypothetical protein
MVDKELGKRLLELRERIVSHFDAGDWEEVGLMTGHSDLITGHQRLLRSLSWGDEDYSGNVLTIIRQIAQHDPEALAHFEGLLDRKYPGESHYISAKPSAKKITFAPNVFEVPDVSVELDLVAVMMPFRAELNPVYTAIQRACSARGFRCTRADDLWEASTIIQDIFNLLLRARIVVVDFTGKNPNVMYETGIAHTLGKLVIPITQSLDDVPFDMVHHRVHKYLPNAEGYLELERKLGAKLGQVGA